MKYDSYKDSKITWIGMIPENWEISIGKRIFDIHKRMPEPEDEVVTCFRDGQVTLRKNRREDGFTFSDKEIGYQRILEGDLVIHGMDAFAGSIGVSDSTGKATPVYIVCTSKNNLCDLNFMSYSLREYARKGVMIALYSGIRERSCNFTADKLSYLPLAVPPIKTQKAIADYLDSKIAQIDSIIADKQNLINLLQEKRQIAISQAVTKGISKLVPLQTTGVPWIGDIPENWNVFKIKYMFKLKGRIGWQGLKSDEYIEEGPYLITGTDFKDGGINWDTCVRISDERYIEAPEIHVKEGDLLITKDGTIGKVAIAQNVPEKASLNSGVLLVRDLGKVPNISKFIYYIILSNQFWYWFYSSLTGNSTILHLYQEKFKEFSFALPPIEEQREIVQYLDKKTSRIDSIIADITEQIEKLNEYRKIVMSEAVTGKIKIAEDGECNVN